MPHLYDNDTGAYLGEISDQQKRQLIDLLEEETAEDRDYWLTADTLDLLERDGADPGLVALLRRALGGREGVEVRWSDTRS